MLDCSKSSEISILELFVHKKIDKSYTIKLSIFRMHSTVLYSRSNAHCDGAAMAPLCKLAKRGAVRANYLPLSRAFKAWPDSLLGRAHDLQSQCSRVRIPLASIIFSHFHFSVLYLCSTICLCNNTVFKQTRLFLQKKVFRKVQFRNHGREENFL